MRFIYYGPFSGGTETHVAMGVGFRGRTPSSTVDPAAIAWFTGNPLFVEVDEEAEPEAAPEAPKAKQPARKRKAKK